jgi:HD-GYP domain-containing protein (c-di-GMP phosphodiesterase class II)
MEEIFKKEDFTEIPIDEFISSKILPVDLYIGISENNFVRVAKAGDTNVSERLQNYKNKEVNYLLIKTGDYESYLEKSLTTLESVITDAETPINQKQDLLAKVAANVFTEIEKMNFDVKIFDHSRALARSAVSFCLKNPNLGAVVTQFCELSPDSLYAHSVAVSTISTMIGIEMDWKQRGTLEKLSLAGLLHDIGLKGLPAALRNKSRAMMTFEEKSEYESHAYLGMDILRSLPEVPDDIAVVAFQHHELGMGFGFPRHLKQFFINPYARVVGLANEFCNMTLPHLNPTVLKTPIEALESIKNVMGQPFWKPAFKALQDLIEGTAKVRN